MDFKYSREWWMSRVTILASWVTSCLSTLLPFPFFLQVWYVKPLCCLKMVQGWHHLAQMSAMCSFWTILSLAMMWQAHCVTKQGQFHTDSPSVYTHQMMQSKSVPIHSLKILRLAQFWHLLLLPPCTLNSQAHPEHPWTRPLDLQRSKNNYGIDCHMRSFFLGESREPYYESIYVGDRPVLQIKGGEYFPQCTLLTAFVG